MMFWFVFTAASSKEKILKIKKIEYCWKGSSKNSKLITLSIAKTLVKTRILSKILASIIVLMIEAEERVLILLWKLLKTDFTFLNALIVGNPSTISEYIPFNWQTKSFYKFWILFLKP